MQNYPFNTLPDFSRSYKTGRVVSGFEYVYYYKAEELGDINQAKKFIESRIIQELSAEYFKSTNGGKNDIMNN